MDALTYSYTRQHLAEVMRKVNEDCTPIIITAQHSKPVVIMSLDEYNGLAETAHLTSSSANARRLAESLERYRQQKGLLHKTLEELQQYEVSEV